MTSPKKAPPPSEPDAREPTVGTATGAAEEEAGWPARVRGGDEAAFEAIVRFYTNRLQAYAERQVGHATLAEELVEDVFVRIWERRASWEVEGSLRRYLYGAVRKAALHALRTRGTRRRVHDLLRRGDRSPAMAQPPPSPEASLEAKELEGLLNDEIARLPPRSREAFLLARQHELSHAEIAGVMGISTSTVEKHVARALGRLRAVLASWLET